MSEWLDSKALMARTGISRATLNNYVALGILPRPHVAAGEGNSRARRIGYFPEWAVDVVARVGDMKAAGRSMNDIAAELREDRAEEADTPAPAPSSRVVELRPSAPERPKSDGSGIDLRLTLDQIDAPAYLVNPRFELEWANDEAQKLLFGGAIRWPAEIAERKFFNMILEGTATEAESADALLSFHLSIAKRRLNKASLLDLELFEGDGTKADRLLAMYDDVTPAEGFGPLCTEFNLAPRGLADNKFYQVHVSFFREGVFFAFTPVENENDTLLHFLARRDMVIRDLMKRRRPYLTDLAVLVADLQSSTMICAELPPEEYFELINDVWGGMSGVLRKHSATHGKHAGDGLVCYFFPQPDSNYVMNAVNCAMEMREAMHNISRRWKNKKNWLNDLKLNTGLHEGQEWFGTYQTPTHVELTVLGDTINMAARLSDLGRDGAVWATKSMLGKIGSRDRERLRYGVRRRDAQGSEILVAETYSRVSSLVDLNDPRHAKFNDISTLAVTEVLDLAEDRRNQRH